MFIPVKTIRFTRKKSKQRLVLRGAHNTRQNLLGSIKNINISLGSDMTLSMKLSKSQKN